MWMPYKRVIVISATLITAGVLGMMVGRLSVPNVDLELTDETGGRFNFLGNDKLSPLEAISTAPPLLFVAGAPPDGNWTAVLEEIGMASEAGLHQYALPTDLAWGRPEQLEKTVALWREVVKTDPQAAIMLRVRCDPPHTWFSQHTEARVEIEGGMDLQVSVASPVWLEETTAGLTQLAQALDTAGLSSHIRGYWLTALRDGQWRQDGRRDVSLANVEGFREWLRRRYGDVIRLREAWGNPAVDFETTGIPEPVDRNDPAQVFFETAALQAQVDFTRYTSDSTADAIALLAAHIKTEISDSTQVWASYGYGCEVLESESGHLSLGSLMGSALDAFVSPVSYRDRGIGGAGGLMGPVDSAALHQKQWYILDDTRTGVARDPLTGAITRLAGLRAEDVYSVQHRNFSAVLTHNLGLAWADPEGEGWLHNAEQWGQLEAMLGVYAAEIEGHKESETAEEETPAEEPPAAVPAGGPSRKNKREQLKEDEAEEEKEKAGEKKDAAPFVPVSQEELEARYGLHLEEEPVDEALEADSAHPEEASQPQIPYETGLMVVLDEDARAFQRYDAGLNDQLLTEGLDTAMRSGVATQFALLQDVLDDRTPLAPVYLFLNVFSLPEADRIRLHSRLTEERACAIWLYAPGYFANGPSAAHVGATVGMNVSGFNGIATTSSRFMLGGSWMQAEEEFGKQQNIAPLFHIEDENADVLAQYIASGKISVAMKYMQAGWTSVFIAEPAITPALLREILTIVEQHIYFRATSVRHYDTTHIGKNLVAVHGKQIGERVVDLGRMSNVVDLLDPNIGWLEKEVFGMTLRMGETRVLKVDAL